MSAFEKYRDQLRELHRLDTIECEGYAAEIRDQETNKIRCRMKKLRLDLSDSERTIAADIVGQLGYQEFCLVVFALTVENQLQLHIIDDDKFDDYATGEPPTGYYAFELIGYDHFLQPGFYPLIRFKDHPRVKEYLKKR